MGLVTGCQPLLQGEALALLCQNLRGVGVGQIGALSLVGSFLGGQLLTIGVGLPLTCGLHAARHQGQSASPFWPPLMRRLILSSRSVYSCRCSWL